MATFIFPSVNDIYGAGSVGDGKNISEENLSLLLLNSMAQSAFVLSGFSFTGVSGLDIDISAGECVIKGYRVITTTNLSVTATALSINYVYAQLTRDGSNNVTGIQGVINTTGIQPSDSIIIGTLDVGAATINVETNLSTIVNSNQYGNIGDLRYQAGTQSISNSTFTVVQFPAAKYSNAGLWDATNYRYVIPYGVDKVQLDACVQFAGNAGGNQRIAEVRKNGTYDYGLGYMYRQPQSVYLVGGSLTGSVVDVVEGDYFDVYVYQDSGGALNVTQSWFGIKIIS